MDLGRKEAFGQGGVKGEDGQSIILWYISRSGGDRTIMWMAFMFESESAEGDQVMETARTNIEWRGLGDMRRPKGRGDKSKGSVNKSARYLERVAYIRRWGRGKGCFYFCTTAWWRVIYGCV